MKFYLCTLTLILILLAGCTQPVHFVLLSPKHVVSKTSVYYTPLSQPVSPCENRFVPHLLDHATTIQGDVVHLYESNGSGLAINDLDNDGDLDIVFGNLAGPNAIFWNGNSTEADGFPTFTKEEMPHGRTRAVNIVDFDGDGWQDIVFARQQARPTLWRNLGVEDGFEHPIFVGVPDPGIWIKAFTTSWADLDVDGDLDLVAASYDTEYTRGDPGAAGGGGAAIFENQVAQSESAGLNGLSFESTSLTFTAQALAILIEDINQDGAVDVLVGNDFYLQDQLWLHQDKGWEPAYPFETMSMNTMSYAPGDLDNDGQVEIFAGDMLPYRPDQETLAAWAPVTQHIQPIQGDPQVMANALHVLEDVAMFTNQAADTGIEATGWSWSAQFGDLDNDGLPDFYVVNGMNAEELFPHLPGNELVEENLVFRNSGDGHFTPMPEWGLNATASGRGMNMADLDQDGDLDIVVNNLLSPAQVFENRLCGGAALLVDLHWPSSQNTRAIGAKLVLRTSNGDYHRTIRAASGYLSGEPAQVHFGFPEGTQLKKLEIIWPDGVVSVVDDLSLDTRLRLER